MKEETVFSINEDFFPSDFRKKKRLYIWISGIFLISSFLISLDIQDWESIAFFSGILIALILYRFKNFNQTYIKKVTFNFRDKSISFDYDHHFNVNETKIIEFNDLKFSIGHSSKFYSNMAQKVIEFYCKGEFLANIRLENNKIGWSKEDLNSLIKLLNSIEEVEQLPPEFPNHL
jgi:hypothetical protein